MTHVIPYPLTFLPKAHPKQSGIESNVKQNEQSYELQIRRLLCKGIPPEKSCVYLHHRIFHVKKKKKKKRKYRCS